MTDRSACSCEAMEGLVGWFTDPNCPVHATGSRVPNGWGDPSTERHLQVPPRHATPDRAAMQERERILAIIRAEPFLVPEPEALHPGEKIAVADYRRRLLEKIGDV